MMNTTDYFVKKIVSGEKSPGSRESRSRIGMIQGWISMAGNFVLFVIKMVLGWLSGSIALMADAFHTLSDVTTSGVVIFGFNISRKPADKEHPFGHGRAETITTLTVSMLIVFVGFEFLKTGITRIMHPEPVESNWIIIAAVVLTIVVKEWMAKLAERLADVIDSDTLRADAIHHRSDMYSSLLVVVALIGAQLGINFLDAVMGIGVSIFMLYSGYSIARSAIDDLLGTPVSKETLDKIRQLACSVEGVYNVHDIIVHRYGTHSFISIHVEVSDKLPSEAMHRIADKVEKKIAHNMEAEVITHMDPITTEGAMLEDIRQIIRRQMEKHELKQDAQDLRLVADSKVESILFEVPVPVGFAHGKALEDDILEALRSSYPDSDILMDMKTQLAIY